MCREGEDGEGTLLRECGETCSLKFDVEITPEATGNKDGKVYGIKDRNHVPEIK